MTTITDIRASFDSIKAELGKGEVATAERQTGKTTALMEFVHEYCSGFCYVVTCHRMEADRWGHKYRQMFPGDKQPVVVTLRGLRGFGVIEGRPRCWVTDEIWPDAAVRHCPGLGVLTYLGGVGTPMCMEMHSR